jgi:hypothetical protein
MKSLGHDTEAIFESESIFVRIMKRGTKGKTSPAMSATEVKLDCTMRPHASTFVARSMATAPPSDLPKMTI